MFFKLCTRLFKLLCYSFILLFVLLSLFFSLMQSKWAKQRTESVLESLLSSTSAKVSIEGLGGTPPFTWTARKITVALGEEQKLEMQDVKLRLAFFPMLRKQLAISYLHAERATLFFSPSIPKQTLVAGRPMLSFSVDALKIPHLTIRSPAFSPLFVSLEASGYMRAQEYACDLKLSALGHPNRSAKAHLLSDLGYTLSAQIHVDLDSLKLFLDAEANLTQEKITTAKAQLTLPDLSLFSSHLRGSVHSEALLRDNQVTASMSTHHVQLNQAPLSEIQASLVAMQIDNASWQTTFSMHAQEPPYPFTLHATLSLEPFKRLQIENISLNADGVDIAGHLDISSITPFQPEGAFYAGIKDLERFHELFPQLPMSGSASAFFLFSTVDGQMALKTVGALKHVHIHNTLIDDLLLQATLKQPFTSPSGELSLEVTNLYTPQLYLNWGAFHTKSLSDLWNFTLDAQGKWHDPLLLFASGSWKQKDAQFTLNLDKLHGTLFKRPLSLPHPCQLTTSPQATTFKHCDLALGSGSVSLDGTFSQEKSDLRLAASHMPIDYRMSQSHLFLTGQFSASGEFHASKTSAEGFLNIALESGGLGQPDRATPMPSKGTLQAHLAQDTLQLHADIRAPRGQFLDLSATLPINASPTRLSLNTERPVSAELLVEGIAEEIFDFVNSGSHHATGLLSSHLLLSGSLSTPKLSGNAEWKEGTYENDYTGTELKCAHATLQAKAHQIDLVEFFAEDNSEGKVLAEGTLYLHPHEHFPYTCAAYLKNLHALRLDTFDAHLTGPLTVKGNTKSALATGTLTAPEASIKISDQLPVDLPVLPVTYIHRPLHFRSPTLLPVFPVHLDLNVSAPDHVLVHGQGLNSEWKGDVHLTGTNTLLAGNGKLTLIKGEYTFAGKVFELTQGEILFSDKPTPSAYLNLTGTLDLSGVTVTATLRGHLTSPQLTFQSNPHMSTSAILAKILFNKDISDISHPEAIQLANALISLSGGAGPDVLDAIRRSIGVDRLTVVSARPGTDQIAVQIGKYLIRGVMVTLSQSATSSQVSVEVELDKGFIFKAETQEEEEGKFTLKWNRNY